MTSELSKMDRGISMRNEKERIQDVDPAPSGSNHLGDFKGPTSPTWGEAKTKSKD